MIRSLRRRLQSLEGRTVPTIGVAQLPDSHRLLTLLERLLAVGPAFGANYLRTYLQGPIAFLGGYVADAKVWPHVEYQCGCTLVCVSGRPVIPGQEPPDALGVLLEALAGLEDKLRGAAEIDHWRARL